MSDHGYSRERNQKRPRRRSPSSPRRSRSRSPRGSQTPRRSRPSPLSSTSMRRRNKDEHRDGPQPSSVLGVFGLATRTTERDLRELFEKYSRVKDVQIVMDKKTCQSRGFGFIYFDDTAGATRAKEGVGSANIDGRLVRIDYSLTNSAHTPTPGVYMGERPGGSHHQPSAYSRRPERRSRKRSRSRSRSRSSSRHHRRGRRSPSEIYRR